MGARSGSSRPDLNTSRWQTLRRQVRIRDGNRCVVCGATEKLSVHHVVKARAGGRDTLDNLVTLCVRHHRQADARSKPQVASDDRPTYEDDPARGIYWGPPSTPGGAPMRWSRHWHDWRPEELERGNVVE